MAWIFFVPPPPPFPVALLSLSLLPFLSRPYPRPQSIYRRRQRAASLCEPRCLRPLTRYPARLDSTRLDLLRLPVNLSAGGTLPRCAPVAWTPSYRWFCSIASGSRLPRRYRHARCRCCPCCCIIVRVVSTFPLSTVSRVVAPTVWYWSSGTMVPLSATVPACEATRDLIFCLTAQQPDPILAL
jgi:hypothetical protein